MSTSRTFEGERTGRVRGGIHRIGMASVALIFALGATTQHYADFGVQVQAITGRTLDDPGFFEEALDNAQRIVLQGASGHADSPS